MFRQLHPDRTIPARADRGTPPFDWSRLEAWLDDPESWEAEMLSPSCCWPAARFSSGWRRRHSAAWLATIEMMQDLGLADAGSTARGHSVLADILDGFSPGWRPEAHGHAEGKKHMAKRGKITRNILWAAGNRASEYEAAFACDQPAPVKTRASRSIVDLYPKFGAASVEVLEAQDAVGEYTEEMAARLGPPVITEVSVACNNSDALRFLVPAMHVNRFSCRWPFEMGGLTDSLHMFLHPTDVASVRDVKAGFLHSLLHEDSIRFACFRDPRNRERVLHFRHCHFGFDFSPWAFWKAEAFVMECYRRLGGHWVQWVDDSLRRYPSVGRCVIMETLICRLQYLHGTIMADNKGHLRGRGLVVYGGLQLSIAGRQTIVPELKLSQWSAQAACLADSAWLEPRRLAGLAGKLISGSPGLRLSRPLVRLLFRIVVLSSSWDQAVRNTPAFAGLLRFIARALPQLNGRAWDALEAGLECSVDASDSGIGMLFSDPWTARRWRVVHEFPAELKALVAQSRAHSTGREALGYYLVACAVCQVPELTALARNRSVQVINDNQSTVRGAQTLGARDSALFLYVLRAHLLLDRHLGAEMRTEWCRRSEQDMPEADALSKPADAGDIGFSPAVARRLASDADVEIVLDGMATRTNAVVPPYWSRYVELSACGTDFLASAGRLQRTLVGNQVVWLYPPWHLLQETLVCIERFRLSCLLVRPLVSHKRVRMTDWSLMLNRLPVVSNRRIDATQESQLLSRGRGVPPHVDIYPGSGYLIVTLIP